MSKLDQKARRLARQHGLIARKSRSRNVLENLGGFMLADSCTKFPVAGFRYDLDAQGVIDYCSAD